MAIRKNMRHIGSAARAAQQRTDKWQLRYQRRAAQQPKVGRPEIGTNVPIDFEQATKSAQEQSRNN